MELPCATYRITIAPMAHGDPVGELARITIAPIAHGDPVGELARDCWVPLRRMCESSPAIGQTALLTNTVTMVILLF